MREIIHHVIDWANRDIDFAVATVISTFSSAPRPAGAAMALASTGEVAGSISGGCVESAVVELAEQVLLSGIPLRHSFGVADGQAFEIGLTCGGIIDVFIQRSSESMVHKLRSIAEHIDAKRLAVLTTVVDAEDPRVVGQQAVSSEELAASTARPLPSEGPGSVEDSMHQSATSALNHTAGPAASRASIPTQNGTVDLLIQHFPRPPQMIICGAIDFAQSLLTVGKLLGYAVTLCDARPTFATPKRFPLADEIVIDWPHRYINSIEIDERSVLCILTHEPKFDIPLLEKALTLPFAYVGAIGSRETCAQTRRELMGRGCSDSQLDRLRAPIGLDIGGRTPAETAISIAAEIISAREGRSGAPLRGTSGPIHTPVSLHAPPI